MGWASVTALTGGLGPYTFEISSLTVESNVVIPEPAAATLVALGLLGLASRRKRPSKASTLGRYPYRCRFDWGGCCPRFPPSMTGGHGTDAFGTQLLFGVAGGKACRPLHPFN